MEASRWTSSLDGSSELLAPPDGLWGTTPGLTELPTGTLADLVGAKGPGRTLPTDRQRAAPVLHEPDRAETPRRKDQGAKPIKGWDGPPYAPNGGGLHQQDATGRWWPTSGAVASG